MNLSDIDNLRNLDIVFATNIEWDNPQGKKLPMDVTFPLDFFDDYLKMLDLSTDWNLCDYEYVETEQEMADYLQKYLEKNFDCKIKGWLSTNLHKAYDKYLEENYAVIPVKDVETIEFKKPENKNKSKGEER